MADYIVRATAAGAAIRAFAITSRDLVETARQDHNTSPIMTAALGRLLSGGAMMGTMLKGEKDLLTLQIQCSGPARGLTVTADANGHVKGFVNNPIVELPPNKDGHLNVGGALDLGILSVIKDMGLKEPYVGQCQLQTGEIAEDLTYYFATSEQIPSAVGLGVLMNKNNTVRQAGGFIIQLMPFTSDEIIEKLEKRMAEIAVLRTHIVNYAKTREVYVAYRKAGYTKKFREEHEEEILLHQAAKNAFDEMGVKKLPKVKELQTEYAKLLEEKKKTYAEYRRSREEMRELLTAKANVDRVLKMEVEQDVEKEKDHGQR